MRSAHAREKARRQFAQSQREAILQAINLHYRRDSQNQTTAPLRPVSSGAPLPNQIPAELCGSFQQSQADG